MTDDALAELLILTVGVECGDTIYRNQHGQIHRVLGPAVIYGDGSKGWYQNNNPHRTDGPAYVASSGLEEWYLDGEEVTEEQWHERVKSI